MYYDQLHLAKIVEVTKGKAYDIYSASEDYTFEKHMKAKYSLQKALKVLHVLRMYLHCTRMCTHCVLTMMRACTHYVLA